MELFHPTYNWFLDVLGPTLQVLLRISELSTLWAMGFGWRTALRCFAGNLGVSKGNPPYFTWICLWRFFTDSAMVYHHENHQLGNIQYLSCFFQASNMQIQGFQMLHPGWWNRKKTLLRQNWPLCIDAFLLPKGGKGHFQWLFRIAE